MKTILVTGGTGFIGSHTCTQLLLEKYKVVIIDNLDNSTLDVLDSIKEISSSNNIDFFKRDLSIDNCNDIFKKYEFYAVIHFAGLKSVGESVKNPLKYYEININSTINLLKLMQNNNCKKLIFSSSATVYGDSCPPFDEKTEIGRGITNAYGKTKFMIEEILQDYSKANEDFDIVILRYFNPIGAHPSGLLGDNPNNIPNNLMPYILKVAYKNNIDESINGYDYLSIFGNNYNTKDGTCMRDYIHVLDLADSHVLSLKKMKDFKKRYNIFNIGLGKGVSVLELVKIFEKVNNTKIPYVISSKREGDIPISYCTTDLSQKYLEFYPKKKIEDMCKDAWNFQLKFNKKNLN